jgi:L-2-hydroxyglutarate oxidase LhgO
MTVALEVLRRRSSTRVAILEKEDGPGRHASGRNSGVLHCGIYYGSETLKAKACSRGAGRMIAYAKSEGIALAQRGKVILATKEEQLPTIERLLRNAVDNGILAERIDRKRLHELEPHAFPGPAAIHCPTTAVIDGSAVLRRLRAQLEDRGATFLFRCHVKGPGTSGELDTSHGAFHYGMLFNCAGAYADVIAKSFGLAGDYALVPFKGIYWKLGESAKHLVNANLYPVPDVGLPFLDVHLTRGISGDVVAGPTAIPALGRENYGVLQGMKLGESLAVGLQLARTYLANQGDFRRLTHVELGKYRKSAFLDAVRRLVPAIRGEDLVASAKVGIRPQLVNTRTHRLEMDYILARTENSLHVLNAISPAFTSAFAFAEMIVDQAP